jgi:hypothetical protein
MSNNVFLKSVTTGQAAELHRLFGDINLGTSELAAILSSAEPMVEFAKFCAMATNGTLTYTDVVVPKRDFSRYDQHLTGLADQRVLLVSYLDKFAEQLGIDREGLNGLKSKLENWKPDALAPAQAITNCQTLIVWLGDLRKTVRFYLLVVEDRQKEAGANGIQEWVDFTTLPMELDGIANQYGSEPDVCLASEINLVDNWDLENGSSVDMARESAWKKQEGGVYLLASVEALATYAVADPKLYQVQDGVNLPFYDMAGIKSGDDLGKSPYSFWFADYRKVDFSSVWSSSVYSICASPSLRSVSKV